MEKTTWNWSQEPYSSISWHLLVFPRHSGFKSPFPVVTIKLSRRLMWLIRDGTRVKFWHDVWCGDNPLSTCFPDLFRISNDKEAYVVDLMQFPNGFFFGTWNSCEKFMMMGNQIHCLFFGMLYVESYWEVLVMIRCVGHLLRARALR